METKKTNNRKISIIASFIGIIGMLFLSLALFSACKNDNESEQGSGNKKVELSLSVVTADLIYGDTLDIISLYNGKEAVTWQSSDEAVAIVNGEGFVSAIGVGECSVTATAGKLSASCSISVSMGNYLPELKVLHLKNDELVIRYGEEFEPEVKVLFNKHYYDCGVEFTSFDNSIVGYADGKLTAKAEGTTTARLVGKWQEFESDRINKEITINVIPNVTYSNVISVNDSPVDTAMIELSVTPSWQNQTYANQAKVSSSVKINGTSHICEFETSDSSLTLVDNGDGTANVTANGTGIGSATVTAKYTRDNGEVFETKIPVEITCPTAEYNEHFEFCSAKPVDVETFFNDANAKVLSASQDGKSLKVETNRIRGVKIAGGETHPLTILTSVGGYIFNNIYAYDVELTSANIVSELMLGSGKIKDGYYVLNSDIANTIDFTRQAASVFNAAAPANDTYFCGTFDGRGHTIKAKVGANGVFGGLSRGAVIKNTQFVFTFLENAVSCGLASNSATFNQAGGSVELNNLHVKTTNYAEKSYSLFDYCNWNLEMHDVFVVLTGAEEEAAKFRKEGIKTEISALFHNDYSATMASSELKFKGGFRNVYVVSGGFMPLVCAPVSWESARSNWYVSYAKNDVKDGKIGDYSHVGLSHIYNYCHIYANAGNEYTDKYFGNIGMSSQQQYLGKKFAWVFTARDDIEKAGGGIERYDTVAELSAKLDSVGTWSVI